MSRNVLSIIVNTHVIDVSFSRNKSSYSGVLPYRTTYVRCSKTKGSYPASRPIYSFQVGVHPLAIADRSQDRTDSVYDCNSNQGLRFALNYHSRWVDANWATRGPKVFHGYRETSCRSCWCGRSWNTGHHRNVRREYNVRRGILNLGPRHFRIVNRTVFEYLA